MEEGSAVVAKAAGTAVEVRVEEAMAVGETAEETAEAERLALVSPGH